MSDVLNPVQIEQAIRETVDNIVKGVRGVSERELEYRAAERAYRTAYAKAYFASTGSVEDKKQRALLATEAEWETRDVAEIAYKASDREIKAFESQLRGFQSMGASVREMYRVAGRGEW